MTWYNVFLRESHYYTISDKDKVFMISQQYQNTWSYAASPETFCSKKEKNTTN